MKRFLESVALTAGVLFCCLTEDSPALVSAGLLLAVIVSVALIPRGR
jgi:hypothetical protein